MIIFTILSAWLVMLVFMTLYAISHHDQITNPIALVLFGIIPLILWIFFFPKFLKYLTD